MLNTSVFAEPYLAVRTGAKCLACHTNPTGGGKRNQFGRAYGQTVLPVESAQSPLTEVVSRYLDIGGNLRANLNITETPNSGDAQNEDTIEFTTERANLYFEALLIPDRLTFYVDQQFSPASNNREAWIMLKDNKKGAYLKAGKFFLPFGLRLEDDTAFVRAISGINFSNADNGIEVGLESGHWSGQLALTNGTAGGAENNKDKQISSRLEYIHPRWRAGVGINTNNGELNNARDMQSIFIASNWMGSEWLFEVDHIVDSSTAVGKRKQLATFFEVNRRIFAGQNLKLTLEFLDPDTSVDEDQRNRVSVVWEYTPLPLLQLRVGARIADSIPQNDAQNADRVFLQLHAFY